MKGSMERRNGGRESENGEKRGGDERREDDMRNAEGTGRN